MGIFRNIQRVLADIAPVVAAVAPIVAPGLGGIIAAQIARGFIPRGVVGARPVPAPANPCQAPAFTSRFQSANFSTGGSLPGRGLAFFNTFQPRSAVGRVALDRCPPTTCPCPATAALPATVAALPQVAGLSPEQQAAVARFTNFSRDRFGRRI